MGAQRSIVPGSVLLGLSIIAAQCGGSRVEENIVTVTVEQEVTVAGGPEVAAGVPAATAVKSSPEPAQTTAEAITYHTMDLPDGMTLQYAVVLPKNFDATREYPVLLAFPPGGQNQAMVQTGLDSYWAKEAGKRGWIVLSPVAPGGQLFFQGSEAYIPEFLGRTAATYRPEGGKYHIAGISNGGLSAFRVALEHPDKVRSLLVLPGFPYTEEDFQQLEKLKNIPVAMFVGEQDTTWLEAMQATEKELSRLGGTVSLEIVPGEQHVIKSLTGEKLFDLLESFR